MDIHRNTKQTSFKQTPQSRNQSKMTNNNNPSPPMFRNNHAKSQHGHLSKDETNIKIQQEKGKGR